MAAQVQLANTFNEFRAAYNDAANDITQLQEGNTLFNTVMSSGAGAGTGALYANTAQIKTLNTSGGRVVVTRGAVSGTGATLEDDAGLGFDSASNRLTVDGPLDANGAVRATQVTANNLTSGRVAIVGTSGLIQDDAELRYLTANNTLIGANVLVDNRLVLSTLTSGRVVLAGLDGQVTDNAGLTYQSSELSVTGKVTATTWANAANINVTTNATVGAWANAANISVSANVNVTDTVNALGHLHAGGVETWLANKQEDRDIHLIAAVDDSDGPHDIAIVNRNNSANAYGEFIAMNNAGNTSQGWVSMGINATNYNQGAFSITKGDDAYILYEAPTGTTKSGDLVIGTGGNGTGNRIIFSANGFDDPANNTQITIDPGNRVHIEIPTQSTSTTTGALTVNGGVGIVGNMNVGGNVAITGTITLTGSGNTVSTDTLAVANAILFLANGNSSDSLDIGYVGQYNNTYFGVVRDRANNRINMFQDLATRPANTTNFGAVNYANTRVGVLHASNTAATSSPATGALIVTGGAGIAGGVWAGGAIRTDSTTASTSTSTGSLIVNGGAGIAGNTHIGGALVVDSGVLRVDATNNRVGVNVVPASGVSLDVSGAIRSTPNPADLNYSADIFASYDSGHPFQLNVKNNGASFEFMGVYANGGGGGEHVRFPTGNVEITSTTSSSSTTTGALVVAGGVGVQGTVTAASLVETSSIALKENINPIDDALETVMKMLGVVYDRKDGSNKNEVGMIAEQLNEIAPNLVGKDENGNPSSIFYTRVTAYLVEAIKKLKNEIDELKGK